MVSQAAASSPSSWAKPCHSHKVHFTFFFPGSLARGICRWSISLREAALSMASSKAPAFIARKCTSRHPWHVHFVQSQGQLHLTCQIRAFLNCEGHAKQGAATQIKIMQIPTTNAVLCKERQTFRAGMSGADIVRQASSGLSVRQSPVQQMSGSFGCIKAILHQSVKLLSVFVCLDCLL